MHTTRITQGSSYMKEPYIQKQRRGLKGLAALLTALTLLVLTIGPVLGAPSTPIRQGSGSQPKIALTFDMGSDAAGLPSILQTLRSYNIKSTFFVTGSSAAAYPNATRQILADGHELGNHSYSHPDFTTLTPSQMIDQLKQTENLLNKQTGSKFKPLFRPPFGAYNASVLETVGNAGYGRTIMWSIDTIDWQFPSIKTIQDRVLNNAHNGAIVLMHVSGQTNTPNALPGMIQGLRAKGYQMVTISELLGITTPPPTGRTHTVKAGDTWWSLSRLYNVNMTQLASANGKTTSQHIYVGEVLVIPGGSTAPPSTITYTVKAGDTLYRIALLHNVTVQAIVNANNIANPNLIRVGQVLSIPR